MSYYCNHYTQISMLRYFKLPPYRIIQHKINGPLCILTRRTTCLCRIITAILMVCSVSWLEQRLVVTVSWSSKITFFGLKNICFRSTSSLCFLPCARHQSLTFHIGELNIFAADSTSGFWIAGGWSNPIFKIRTFKPIFWKISYNFFIHNFFIILKTKWRQIKVMICFDRINTNSTLLFEKSNKQRTLRNKTDIGTRSVKLRTD